MTQVTEEQIRQDLENLYEASNIVITDDETEPFDRRLIDFIVSQRLQGVAEAMAMMAGFSLDFVDGGVDTVATENIDLEGWQDLWGVDGGDDKLVAVVGQTAKSQNGLYRMKQGLWVREEGYTTPQELSRIAFFVADGLRLGEMYVQPQNLTSPSDPKIFTLGLNLNKALKALIGKAKEEKDDQYETITGTTTTEEQDGQPVEVFTSKNEYNVKEKVGSFQLAKVKLKQGTVSEVEIKKGTEWTYDPDMGKLWISPAVLVNYLEGHEIHLCLSTSGTDGMAYGVVLKNDESNFYFRRADQSDADLQISGPIPTPIGGGSAKTYVVNTPVYNGHQFQHQYNTQNIDVVVKNAQGRIDPLIAAYPVDNSHFALSIPEGEPFTGKLFLSVYPETVEI